MRIGTLEDKLRIEGYIFLHWLFRISWFLCVLFCLLISGWMKVVEANWEDYVFFLILWILYVYKKSYPEAYFEKIRFGKGIPYWKSKKIYFVAKTLPILKPCSSFIDQVHSSNRDSFCKQHINIPTEHQLLTTLSLVQFLFYLFRFLVVAYLLVLSRT